MLTSSDFKNIITANLNDDRIFSIQAFLARLIERKTYGNGIEQYRIRDRITNSWVTSLNDFIFKLDTNSIKADYFYYSDKMTGDRIHPIAVNLTNFDVYLNEYSGEDIIYFSMFGKGVKHILFLINYISDNDPVLPLKIFEIRLID